MRTRKPSDATASRPRSRCIGLQRRLRMAATGRDRRLDSLSGLTAGSPRSSASRRRSAPTARRSSTRKTRSAVSVSAESAQRTSHASTGMLRERGCSPSTRAKHLRVLGACLQAAVFYRYADSNPVRELPPAAETAAGAEGGSVLREPGASSALRAPSGRAVQKPCAWSLSRRGCGRESCSRCAGATLISIKRSCASGRAIRAALLGTPKNRERRDVDLISDVVELLTQLARQARRVDRRPRLPRRERHRLPLAHGSASAPPLPGDGRRRDPDG